VVQTAPAFRLRSVVFAAVLLATVCGVVKVVFLQSQPATFHNYGVVNTSIGVGAVACGGEVSAGCGVESTIRFEQCSPRYYAYYDAATPERTDQLVRRLTGARPPSGNRWTVQCGAADAMIVGQPPVRLESN
jgi:hypothetical protein